MSARLGTKQEDQAERAKPLRLAAETMSRWVEVAGAQCLVVDPGADGGLVREMAARGVHVTVVGSTVDALVEYGRIHPNVVLVAVDAPGLPPSSFVEIVRGYGSPYVIAVLDTADQPEAGSMLCAGAMGIVVRPYNAAAIWGALSGTDHAFESQVRVSYGPIELDARAYTVTVDGERIPDLPLKDFTLLRALLFRAPEVLANDDLRAAVWGGEREGPADNTIAVHVGRLRVRLEGVAEIRRVRGRGYSLVLG